MEPIASQNKQKNVSERTMMMSESETAVGVTPTLLPKPGTPIPGTTMPTLGAAGGSESF